MQVLFVFLALALGGADVYRWVDADGQAHYSDQPQPGAERITINVSPQASGSPVGAGAASSSQVSASEPPAPGFSYESLTITSPAQEQVLWNIGGQLDVAASVQPSLQEGHVLQFFLDGQMLPAEPGATQTRFSEVFRGAHTLRAQVVDESGQSLLASPMITFYVRQASVQ